MCNALAYRNSTPPRPQVINMKPVEILSLLEEASGTRLYEKKKEAAMKTMEKKQAKLDEIDQVRSLVHHVQPDY